VIHPTAIVHPGATLGHDVEIGPYCLVGDNVTIGARTKLLAQVIVNGHTTIGEDCTIHPFASLGGTSQDRKAADEISYTRIGDRTIVREYASIHRATGPGRATSVGNDCLLLAYTHVAHNCQIGNDVTMSNLAQLAGQVVIEDHAGVGGMAGAHQDVRVGAYAFVGGMTRLTRDVPPYFLAEGNPPEVHGLNSVGLRRRNFSTDVIAELKNAYKIIYRSGLNLRQAIEALRNEGLQTDAGRHLLAFLEAPSERGVLK
jgi:UDP-N-acetylglucosamine acyltransferase